MNDTTALDRKCVASFIFFAINSYTIENIHQKIGQKNQELIDNMCNYDVKQIHSNLVSFINAKGDDRLKTRSIETIVPKIAASRVRGLTHFGIH